MKKLFKYSIAILFISFISLITSLSYAQERSEEKLQWKLGAQSYTFNRFTFFESIDKIKSCDLSYVEAYPGQPIGGNIEGIMDFNMSAEKRDHILEKLEISGVKLISFGVVSIDSEDDWNNLFQFAKAMGIENITAEPKTEHMPLISKLAEQFEIKIAIHNHPKPTKYWNPETVLNTIQGHNKWIGVCADIGHWVRSGLDPVECLKKLEGHIIQLHFKDMNKSALDAHDVPWGQGVSNVDGVLGELKRQNFKGLFSVEYEHNWDNNVPEIQASVRYFRKTVEALK